MSAPEVVAVDPPESRTEQPTGTAQTVTPKKQRLNGVSSVLHMNPGSNASAAAAHIQQIDKKFQQQQRTPTRLPGSAVHNRSRSLEINLPTENDGGNSAMERQLGLPSLARVISQGRVREFQEFVTNLGVEASAALALLVDQTERRRRAGEMTQSMKEAFAQKILFLLAEGANPMQKVRTGGSTLYLPVLSAMLGMDDLTSEILLRVNVRSLPRSPSILGICAEERLIKSVRLLIRLKYPLQECDRLINRGMMPLHHACVAGDLRISEDLIKAGADIDAKDKTNERTPLMMAAIHGKKDVAELLISHHADVHALDKKGHNCVFFVKDPEVLQLLFRHGVDGGILNHSGISALAVAERINAPDSVKQMLRDYGRSGTAFLPRRVGLRIPRERSFLFGFTGVGSHSAAAISLYVVGLLLATGLCTYLIFVYSRTPAELLFNTDEL
eukprot:Clim_evm14s207 gene=Clim_evmTU14s207